MPYSTPTLQTLLNQAASDISSSELAGADGFLPMSVLGLMGMVMAGFSFGHYDAIAYAARQATPFYATDEYLEGWAALKGVYRKDATAAGANGLSFAVFTGTPGTDLPAGTPVNRGDGFAYTTLSDASVPSGGTTVTAPIVATTAGAAGNCPAGTILTLGTGITGIAAQGSASTPITGGADQEIDDDLRSRMLIAYANPPAGGDQQDYVEWAGAVAGVTRAWCAPNGAGAGTVVIFTMFDNAEAATGGFPVGTNGVASGETRDTPATGDQLAVANAIFAKRPVTALVYSCAPTALLINYAIGELSPNTETIQAGIQAALVAMHLRKAQPGGTWVDGSIAGGTIWPSDWNEAIAAVPGIAHFNVTFPTAAVVAPKGNLPTVGTVSYSST
jgi:uncharacterized phage protein gp47/JayE